MEEGLRSREAADHGASMPRTSAGLLPYRRRDGQLEVLLVHPGGPFWANKDTHAWSVAKGEVEPGEDLLNAAHREFFEETGLTLEGPATPLAPVRQPAGKIVYVWAVEADIDPSAIRSNSFLLEWPPRSGHVRQFPEVDRAAWLDLGEARSKIHKGQVALLDELLLKVSR
jgi:predicted NUDIX family NTP pyrophosphohydrolase